MKLNKLAMVRARRVCLWEECISCLKIEDVNSYEPHPSFYTCLASSTRKQTKAVKVREREMPEQRTEGSCAEGRCSENGNIQRTV